MRLGVYVGSFNPVHKGHIHVVNYLLNNNYVDKIILLATPNYWDKQDIISEEHRINMLKYFETDKIIVDTENNNYQYTYQVLNALQDKYKEDELYLIIGSDNLEKFHLWKRLDIIFKHKILVLKRDNTDIDYYINKFNNNCFIKVEGFTPINISSTAIRNNKDLSYLDKKVYNYIQKNNLYGGN